MNKYIVYLKRLTRKFGIELARYNLYSSRDIQLQRLFLYNRIETVIDIGANIGQYAMELRANGFKGRIISFEPILEAYTVLKKNSQKDPEWIVPERMAIGNKDSEIEMNFSANSVSSSILPIKESHVKAAPESVYVRKEIVSIRRLDSVAERLDLKSNIYLKVDVQGYELDVLKGASTLLKKTKGLQLELSLVELYEGQILMGDMLRYVESLGFKLSALFPVFIDESSSRLLQVDGVFFSDR